MPTRPFPAGKLTNIQKCENNDEEAEEVVQRPDTYFSASCEVKGMHDIFFKWDTWCPNIVV
jgi:hypothetical protein